MLSILSFARVVFAAQVIQAVHGRLALRMTRSNRHQGGDALKTNHMANQLWPKAADFFTMDAEQMDEVPNVEAGDGHTCHPKCWWGCGIPAKCDTKCTPKCSAPKCVTTCEKQSMAGCSRLCDAPKCAVICPESCKKGGCPECTTVCTKPRCSLDCSRKCSSHCDDPVCSWHCETGRECRYHKPACKMRCEKPTCALFKGKTNNLIDIYRGLGDPTEEQAAVYGVKEVIRTDYATVPGQHLRGLAGAPMEGSLSMAPPWTMGSARWMRPPWRRHASYYNHAPWRLGWGRKPVPCRTGIANCSSVINWHGPPDEREEQEGGAQRNNYDPEERDAKESFATRTYE